MTSVTVGVEVELMSMSYTHPHIASFYSNVLFILFSPTSCEALVPITSMQHPVIEDKDFEQRIESCRYSFFCVVLSFNLNHYTFCLRGNVFKALEKCFLLPTVVYAV